MRADSQDHKQGGEKRPMKRPEIAPGEAKKCMPGLPPGRPLKLEIWLGPGNEFA